MAHIEFTYSVAPAGLVNSTRVSRPAAVAAIAGRASLGLATGRVSAAATPMSIYNTLSPEQVAPLAAFLVHEDCVTTGEWFTAGGGYVGRVALSLNGGFKGRPLTPEKLRDEWTRVMGADDDFHISPPGATGEIRTMMQDFTR